MPRPKKPDVTWGSIEIRLANAGLTPLESQFEVLPAPNSPAIAADLDMLAKVVMALEAEINQWKRDREKLLDPDPEIEIRGLELQAARLEAMRMTLAVTRTALSGTDASLHVLSIIEDALQSAATGTGSDYKKLICPTPTSSKYSPENQKRRAIVFAIVKLYPDKIHELSEKVAEHYGIPKSRIQKSIENFLQKGTKNHYLLEYIDRYVDLFSEPEQRSGSIAELLFFLP